MPVDLKKFQRIFLIHQKLRTKRRYTWDELAEACQSKLDVKVSQRTIEYDIDALKNQFHAPVKKRKGMYFYEDRPYSLFEVFDDSEYGSLNELLALLRQQKADKWVGLDEILIKLEQKTGVFGGEGSSFIEFEQTSLKGLDYMEFLYKSIKERRVLKISYKPYESDEKVRIVLPIYLKQYNNRWFLLGWEKGRATIQTFALDRISQKPIFWNESMDTKLDFDIKEYFNDVIGVTVNDVPIKNIQLRILKPRAYYIQTKKIHHSQIELYSDEYSIAFQISVKPNNEMWAKFMELAEDLELIEPSELKKEFQERTLRFYSPINKIGK
ncbi:MAG: WYL domain-containing protein [Spirosomaceae bacterium]|jgi:predicted DNA-binding transcriptional regulator YafY|nr:WYL domain-containing protein [Spirosomataceae bacterium]